MKKENKCAIRSILAILLCAMLVTSNMGTVAFAVERSLAQMDAEEAASGPESDGAESVPGGLFAPVQPEQGNNGRRNRLCRGARRVPLRHAEKIHPEINGGI